MTRTTYDADDGEIPKRTSSSIYLIHDSSKNSFYLKYLDILLIKYSYNILKSKNKVNILLLCIDTLVCHCNILVMYY